MSDYFFLGFHIEKPPPLSVVVLKDAVQSSVQEIDAADLFRRIAEASSGEVTPELLRESLFRATSFDLLTRLLATGVDVDPPDAPIRVGSFESVLAQGGWPKVIAAYQPDQLRRTFVEVPQEASPDQIAILKREYPNASTTACGTKLWLSRLGINDGRRATPLERDELHWIPANPRAALRAVVVLKHRHQDDDPKGAGDLFVPKDL